MLGVTSAFAGKKRQPTTGENVDACVVVGVGSNPTFEWNVFAVYQQGLDPCEPDEGCPFIYINFRKVNKNNMYIRDAITPRFIGTIISHNKDPYQCFSCSPTP